MRTSNPTLSDKAFSKHTNSHNAMTVDGTVNKSFILIILAIITFIFTWETVSLSPEFALLATGVSVILGLILAIVLVFKQEWAPYLAPAYALTEGVVLGAISYLFEMMYPGIVFQAIFLTLGVFLGLLFVYKSGLIKVTNNFRLGVFAATAGIALVYIISMVLGFFGKSVPLIHESGLVGIGFSVFVVIIAALNLVLDFDFIEKGAHFKAPKYMEWYAAFGLLVTLVWLYIEILKLLAKLRDRN